MIGSRSNSAGRNERRSADAPTDVDKESLYGEYLRSSRWRDDLHRKAAHKALDIADDEMAVNTTINRSGFGWKELATLGAIALGGWYAFGRPATPPPDSPSPAATSPANDSWWEYSGRVWQPGEVPE